MSMVTLVCVLLVIRLYLSGKEKANVAKMVFGLAFVAVVMLIFLASTGRDEIFEKIPLCSIESVDYVEADGGSFYLYTGAIFRLFKNGVNTTDYFHVDDNTSAEDMQEWLMSQDKAVYMVVGDGLESVFDKDSPSYSEKYAIDNGFGKSFSKFLGYCKWSDIRNAEQILSIYNNWCETGEMPVMQKVYKFLIFDLVIEEELLK